MKELTSKDFQGKTYTRVVKAMQISEDFKLVARDDEGNITGSIGGLAGDYIVKDADGKFYVHRKDVFESHHKEK